MTQQELTTLLRGEVEKRVKAANEKKAGLKKCEELFKEMHVQGWHEAAESFSEYVSYTMMLHPEWSDDDVLRDYYEHLVGFMREKEEKDNTSK